MSPVSLSVLDFSPTLYPPIYVHCDSPLLFILLPSFLLSASIRTLARCTLVFAAHARI